MTVKQQSTLRFGTAASCIALAALAFGACAASAQQRPTGLPDSYPNKPIRFVVPSLPGGGQDAVARPVAQHLSERWGSPVLVENRTGFGIAIDHVVKSTPDGHTLYLASPSNFIEAALAVKVPYDVQKALVPVASLTVSPFVMVVSNDLPVKSVRELIAYAKGNPGKISYASAGPGTLANIGGELMKLRAGIDMVHIPYKGIGPGIVDMLGGRIQMLLSTPGPIMPHVKSGKIRALGVTSPKRAQLLPDLPAINETIRDFEIITFFGLYTPEKTPQPVVTALNKEINVILGLPTVISMLTTDGSETVPGTPELLRGMLAKTMDTANKLIKESRIKLD